MSPLSPRLVEKTAVALTSSNRRMRHCKGKLSKHPITGNLQAMSGCTSGRWSRVFINKFPAGWPALQKVHEQHTNPLACGRLSQYTCEVFVSGDPSWVVLVHTVNRRHTVDRRDSALPSIGKRLLAILWWADASRPIPWPRSLKNQSACGTLSQAAVTYTKAMAGRAHD